MSSSSLPPDRRRWRFTIHRRDFATRAYARTTGITELTEARSRRLELALNTPAKLTWSLDGRSPSAPFVEELQTEVLAWRYDETLGQEVLMFRGIVTQSEDVISEQTHTVNFTALDYLAILNRRYLTTAAAAGVAFAQVDQDDIVASLLSTARTIAATGGHSFSPGAWLALVAANVNPDGTARAAKSGQLRDRTYLGQQSIGEAITALAAVINGFDLDVQPAADTDGQDYLRLFYPSQGLSRTDVVLAYGSSVSSLTRSANSVDYGNYWRVIGDNGGTAGAPQLYADAWNADSNDVGRIPVGLWQSVANESDVKVAATLQQKASGDLAVGGMLVPSYSLSLRPDWFRPGAPAMGDTVPLEIRSGRLDVSTTVRVLGISYAISDDAAEDVELTVGRPALDLSALFRRTRQDVDALARR